jgi:hypothetical protein
MPTERVIRRVGAALANEHRRRNAGRASSRAGRVIDHGGGKRRSGNAMIVFSALFAALQRVFCFQKSESCYNV